MSEFTMYLERMTDFPYYCSLIPGARRNCTDTLTNQRDRQPLKNQDHSQNSPSGLNCKCLTKAVCSLKVSLVLSVRSAGTIAANLGFFCCFKACVSRSDSFP